MGSRGYLVGGITVAQWIWGWELLPCPDWLPSWVQMIIVPFWIAGVPMAAWYFLKWVWRVWQPNAETEDRLDRALAAVSGGIIAVLAVFQASADAHIGNTMWQQTGEGGMEAVGEDIVLPGPDWHIVIMLFIFAGVAFWQSVAKKKLPSRT